MSKENTNKFLEASKNVLRTTSPLTMLLIDSTEKVFKVSANVSEKGIKEIQEEVLRQELMGKMSEVQAKVAQEVAIARRIDTAEEVEIEEFYDTSGEGGVGLSSKKEKITIGADGSSRRVTKRNYRFKGWRDGGLEVVDTFKE